MPAAWLPIVTERLFQKAQTILKANTDRYMAAARATLYLLSGLLACGKCGQRLQGKSAYSSKGKRHRYYSHRTKCPEGGLDRIDAEMAQELVLGWLRDVASNGEKFRELEAQGGSASGGRSASCGRNPRSWMPGSTTCRRTDRGPHPRADPGQGGAGPGIHRAEHRRPGGSAQGHGGRALLAQSIAELESLVSKDKSLFSEYRAGSRRCSRRPEVEQKIALAGLVASLLLQDGGIK